jgi:predicted site-specific integrase-resolvase
MALAKIGKVAKMLGVEVSTLRAWERSGELVPARRSKAGIRYYDLDKVTGLSTEPDPGLDPGLNHGLGGGDALTVGYARVFGSGQEGEVDLSRQEELLAAFCAAKGWRHEVISDHDGSGSGTNYLGSPGQKRDDHTGPGLGSGLKQLIKLILGRRIRRLVITRKDRLSRFGADLILTLCEIQNIEVVVLNRGDSPTLGEEELAQDIELRQLCERLINGADAGAFHSSGIHSSDIHSSDIHSSGEPSTGGNTASNGKASPDPGTVE